jgi:uncharacterized protein
MARRYDGPIVDVDLHHNWKTPAEVAQYLPEEWRDYTLGNIPRGPRSGIASSNVSGGMKRRDAYRVPEETVCSDIDFVREQLLDRYNFWRSILTFDTGQHGNTENPYFGAASARAANEWTADTWLTWDDRLYSVISIGLGLPEEAAKEIRRAGQNPRFVATLLPGAPDRPYGDPIYDPIWAAASEMDLPIDIHPGAGAPREAGGMPTSNFGVFTTLWHNIMHQLTSCIVHGVFEKWPATRVLVKEFGTAWLPYFMMNLDRNYEALKLESRWVRKWPSEYIREHVKLGTQPIEDPEDPADLQRLYQAFEMEDLLCFATDYAHATFDDPDVIARRLPDGWARKVMCDNACRHYGWTPPPAARSADRDAVAGRA